MTTLSDVMDAKCITMECLSKDYGVPWEILFDIFVGRVEVNQCDADVVHRLAQAFDMSIENILNLEPETPFPGDENLEKDLPRYLQRSIDELRLGAIPIDLLLDDLYGSINSAFWDNEISKEQAEYLRSKYLDI